MNRRAEIIMARDAPASREAPPHGQSGAPAAPRRRGIAGRAATVQGRQPADVRHAPASSVSMRRTASLLLSLARYPSGAASRHRSKPRRAGGRRNCCPRGDVQGPWHMVGSSKDGAGRRRRWTNQPKGPQPAILTRQVHSSRYGVRGSERVFLSADLPSFPGLAWRCATERLSYS